MRCIDADALMAEMHNVILEDGEDRRIFYEVIERQPTIEPERKKGKWLVIRKTGLALCECGYMTDRYSVYNFCPECGADMRGDEHD